MWDLIEDVGGFHDGMFLVCQLFMGFYSALNFRVEFLNRKIVDGIHSKKLEFENSNQYKGMVDKFNSSNSETT